MHNMTKIMKIIWINMIKYTCQKISKINIFQKVIAF